MSVIIPMNITTISIRIAGIILMFDIPFVVMYDMSNDNTNVRQNACITHFDFDSAFFVNFFTLLYIL